MGGLYAEQHTISPLPKFPRKLLHPKDLGLNYRFLTAYVHKWHENPTYFKPFVAATMKCHTMHTVAGYPSPYPSAKY